jgi:phenylalanyl-tRNA synthetase beta chain
VLFSLQWLRLLSPVEATDSQVATALTGRGLTVDSLDGAGADATLDVDVPANRPDCLGHLGIARELSAAFGTPLASRDLPPPSRATTGDAGVEVRIDEPDLCRRYTASVVRDVRIGPSPDWVVSRLEQSGLRSINNVVDASNLVLLETGNPVHFFDLRRLSDRTVVVRLAETGERLTTLDGVERKLTDESLVIADGKNAIALAGVIGGAETEIQDDTSEVLVEAAWFAPQSIRRTSRRFELATDASHRFTRGVDLEALPDVQALAVRLLTELGDGRADAGLIDVYPQPFEPRTVELRLDQVERLLGYRPADGEVRDALEALFLAPSALDNGRVSVEPPSYRGDLQREVDLVEEVARHLGYDRIPATTPEITVTRTSDPARDEELVRDVVAPLGFSEVFGYSMIGSGDDDRFVGNQTPEALKVDNPISGAMGRLRRSLLPGLLRSLDLNLRRGTTDVRLFEVGRIFLSDGAGELPGEPRRVGLAWSGRGRPLHWGEGSRNVDLYDLVGVVERLIGAIQPTEAPAREPFELGAFHPGHSVRWTIGAAEVAWAGRLHPELEQELPQPAFMAEVELDALIELRRPLPLYRPLPRVGQVNRDLAVVLDAGTAFGRVVEVLESVDPPAEVRFRAVDRYVGAPLADGESAVTVRVTLQPRDQSLTDEQIEAYRQALISRLGEVLSVRIRG